MNLEKQEGDVSYTWYVTRRALTRGVTSNGWERIDDPVENDCVVRSYPYDFDLAKIGLDAFITKGEAIARVTAMVAAKRASLLKQLANLDAVDPVAMVNAAGTEKPPPQ